MYGFFLSFVESKRSEIGCMFGRRGMDVLALCETKMKGKGEVTFGEVTGRVSGVERGRAREGVALLLSEWTENKVVEWKEVSSRLFPFLLVCCLSPILTARSTT